MKRLLVFHPALAPYRIDFFNQLSAVFEARFYFFHTNLLNQKFDTELLNSLCNFTPRYITRGFKLGHRERAVRFGFLKKIVKYKPDIVLCSEYSHFTFLIVLFCRILYPKTKVFTICDDSLEIIDRCSKIREISRILCTKLLDGLILCNDDAERWYNRTYPKVSTIVMPIIQEDGRIRTIMNEALPITNSYIEKLNLKETKVILFVGRLTAVKNLQFLIEVFEIFQEGKSDAYKLVLVGHGESKEQLEELIVKKHLKDKVILTGRFEGSKLLAWYSVADCFVLPSTSEAFGAVVNEALIAGLPVVCSNLAGASCLVNDKNGLTFDPYSQEELVKAFEFLFKNMPAKRENVLRDSLMPYTFKGKMEKVINYLTP